MFGNYFTYLGRKRTSSTVTIDVQAGAYSTTVVDPTDATCSVTFDSLGNVTLLSDTGSTYTWRIGGASSDYSIRYDTGSTLEIGTPNAWQSFPYSFGITRTTVGNKLVTGTIRIKRNSDSVELDSATVSLSATVEASGGGGGGLGGGGGGSEN